jgi:hypothetical protein
MPMSMLPQRQHLYTTAQSMDLRRGRQALFESQRSAYKAHLSAVALAHEGGAS